MVVFMQWVRKRHYILATLYVIALASFITFVSTISIAIQKQPSLIVTTTCFESVTATLRVTTTECAQGLVPLGSDKLVAIPDSSGVVTQLHPLLLARFTAAAEVARREGVHLYLTSGFRTKERQLELYQREIMIRGSETEAAKWVLPPWYSHHPQGLALDINYPQDPEGAAWLERHGSRFGLCRVYANEWWHFEGVIAPGQACPPLQESAISDIDPSSIKLSPDQ